MFGSNSLDGGSSPMVKPKGDKQVEYLDLDLDSGKSTPPRKVNKMTVLKKGWSDIQAWAAWRMCEVLKI